MAFGPILTIPDGQRTVILAPFSREDTLEFINPGMQQMRVTKYLRRQLAPVAEDEFEWHERVRQAKDSLVWGIWLEQNGAREIIGVTSLVDIRYGHVNVATSGIQISKPKHWGTGIASLAHRARTWYAFEQKGLHCIKSAVIQGNEASKKALHKVGYVDTNTERNEMFIDGTLRHAEYLAVVNPAELFWQTWWGSDTPSDDDIAARERTREVLTWCNEQLVV